MKKHTNKIIGAAFLMSLALLAGCTKKVAYDYENREDVQAKSIIDQNADYLYVPSTANSTRTSEVARPYWQGEEKIVRLEFTDKSLQVLEVDRETRFSDNATNKKLVMEIPVKHIQYKCDEDKYGDCTQRETQDSDLNWAKRINFKPEFENTKIVETNTLPIELENLFTGNCYKESGSKFLGYEITDDKINFQIERNFSAEISCLKQLNKLSDLNFSQVYHYSFVKLKSVASKNFKPIQYPQTDDSTFGFFTTENVKLDVDSNSSEKDKETLMNHWNPNRETVNYYLDKNYSKPENAAIRDATYLAFDRINQGLAEANVKLRLKLNDNSGQVPGDITNSMIVLVEDPSASSVLGYGPTATNPLTGEILSGRVIMYKGILETYIKYTYDDFRRHKLAEKSAQKKSGTLVTADKNLFLEPLAGSTKTAALKENVKSLAKIQNQQKINAASVFTNKDIKNIEKSVKNYTKFSNEKQDNALFAASKHCLYSPEALGIDGKLSAAVTDVVGDELRPWEELSSNQKSKIINTILPATFVSVLVHELGHNLGLRHNFSGSEDKANFYKGEELARHHLDHESPYSSAMEYGSNELDNLVVLGKYDIAALRFGYNREVETKTGELIKLDTTLEDKLNAGTKIELKEYMYCTDENVGPNPGCKRFDAGTTYVEIANQLIENYESRYFLRNFRNGRLNFSMLGDLSYAGSVDYTFDNLRTFFEVRERIKYQYGLPDDAPEWESVEFLKDLNEAVKISARFFMKVLTMPNTTCAVALVSNPSNIVGLVPLTDFGPGATTCYDAKLNENYTVVGSYGKSFQSIKSADSKNAYLDQIDVRGIWPDKVLAAKYLFGRKLGSYSFDKLTDNYTDIAELQDEVVNTSLAFVLNQSIADVEIKDKNGLVVVSGKVPVETLRSQVIPEALEPRIAKALGVPEKESLFVQTFMKIIATQQQSTMTSINSGRAIADLFKVHKANVLSPINTSITNETLSTVIGDSKYVAEPENQVAYYLISRLKVQEVFNALNINPNEAKAIMTLRSKGMQKPASATLTAAQNYLWDTDMTELEQTLNENVSDLTDTLSLVPGYQ